jgi:hypothetical protein
MSPDPIPVPFGFSACPKRTRTSSDPLQSRWHIARRILPATENHSAPHSCELVRFVSLLRSNLCDPCALCGYILRAPLPPFQNRPERSFPPACPIIFRFVPPENPVCAHLCGFVHLPEEKNSASIGGIRPTAAMSHIVPLVPLKIFAPLRSFSWLSAQPSIDHQPAIIAGFLDLSIFENEAIS